MIDNARELARIIQANPDVTDDEKKALGLAVRAAGTGRVAPPASAPWIRVVSADGTYVKIRLRDVDNLANTRGKPAGVIGAAILTAFGASPPLLSDRAAWTWQGNISRVTTTINFAGQPSGQTAWITGLWFNAKQQTSPLTQPVSVQIPGQLAAKPHALALPQIRMQAA